MVKRNIRGKAYAILGLGTLVLLGACGSPEPQSVTTTHTVTTQSPDMTPPMPASPPASATTTTTVEKHY